MTASLIRFALAATFIAATVGTATAQNSGVIEQKSVIARIRIDVPDTQIFQVFLDRKPVTVLYRKGSEVGLELMADEGRIECRHDLAVVTSDGRLADLPGVNFCDSDWIVTVAAASLSGGTGSKTPAQASPATPSAEAASTPADADCGWLAIMACERDAAAAERESTRIMGGVSVVSTNDYQGLEPDLFCAAQGPYATESEAEQTAGFFRGKGAPDAYTRQACEAAGAGRADAGQPLADSGSDLAGGQTGQPTPQASDLEPGWNLVPSSDGLPMLAYADPSSDTAQFTAFCGGDGISIILDRVPDGAAAGSQIDTVLDTGAFRQRYRATVTDDGTSVVVATDPRDPLWRALAAHVRLDVVTGALRPYSLSLRGSSAAVRRFVDACGRAPSAPAGTPASDADAGAGVAPGAAARYACSRGPRLEVFFDRARDRAVVSVEGGEPMALDRAQSGSTALYAAGGYQLQGNGSEVTWTEPGGGQFACRGE